MRIELYTYTVDVELAVDFNVTYFNIKIIN